MLRQPRRKTGGEWGGGGGEGVTQGGGNTSLSILDGGTKAPVAAVVPGPESALGSQRQRCKAKEWAPGRGSNRGGPVKSIDSSPDSRPRFPAAGEGSGLGWPAGCSNGPACTPDHRKNAGKSVAKRRVSAGTALSQFSGDKTEILRIYTSNERRRKIHVIQRCKDSWFSFRVRE